MNCRHLSRVLKDRGLRSVRTEIPVRRSDLWLIFLLVFQTRVAIAPHGTLAAGSNMRTASLLPPPSRTCMSSSDADRHTYILPNQLTTYMNLPACSLATRPEVCPPLCSPPVAL